MDFLNDTEKRWAFMASSQFYLTLSLLFGTWVIYIPHFTEKLEITEAQLGIALFISAMGSLTGTVLSKKIIQKYGEGLMSLVSVLIKSAGLLSIFFSFSYYQLCFSMFIFGFGGGIFQVAVNSLTSIIERTQKITIMSACHGFFSLGGLFATGFGTVLLIWIGNPIIHAMLSIATVLVLQVIFFKKYYPIKNAYTHKVSNQKAEKSKMGILLWLAVVAILVMINEGAIADWSGLYLKNVVKSNPKYLGLAYAAFSLAMAIGRFSGDYFSKKIGGLKLMLFGFVFGSAGFILVLTTIWLFVWPGFFIIGLGFSFIVPEAYRLSANINGIDAATGVSFIAGAGYVGFLGGPVSFGFIAEAFGLTTSFIAMLGLSVFGVLLILPKILEKKSTIFRLTLNS